MPNLVVNIYVSTGITWVAASLALIMRMFARRMTKVNWWYDDWFCILAYLFGCGYSATILEWTMHWSLGQYMPEDIDPADRNLIIRQSNFLGFLNSLTYAFSIAFAKLAILCLYWRIFKMSNIRVAIQVMIVLSGSWIILRTFMVIFRCIPVQYYWDKSIEGECKIKDTALFFSTVLSHFLMDLAILALPVFEVFKLRLRLGQKLAIIGLFLVGSIVCLASIFALIEAIRYDPTTTQMPYAYAMYCIWGSVEINIAIVSACFPLLRPIFTRVLPTKFLSSYGNSSRTSRPSRPSNAIRLTTLVRTNKDNDDDDNSSQHQLADPERGMVGAEFDHGVKSVRTVITSPFDHKSDDDADMDGIYVQNEMVVEVNEIGHRKG